MTALCDDMVITGLGAVTPLGNDVPSTWSSLLEGESAVRKEPEGYLAARLSGLKSDGNFYKRRSEILRLAVSEALEYSGIPRDSSGLFILCQSKPALEIFDNFFDNLPGLSAASVVADFDFKKKITKNIVAACSGGMQAIFSAVNFLNSTDAVPDVDFAVVGAVETSICPLYASAFFNMGVLARHRVMPFDLKREGFAIGEGAAAIVIEKKSSVLPRRKTRILAEINGMFVGASSNVLDIGDDSEIIARAIRFSTSVKNLSFLSEVDYIHAHGTATRSNDLVEVSAIREVFKGASKKVSISSTKAATGHLLGASGILGTVFAVCAIKHKKIPPTLNLEEPIDTELDFTPTHSRAKETRRAMALAYGFGSQVGAVVVGEPGRNS